MARKISLLATQTIRAFLHEKGSWNGLQRLGERRCLSISHMARNCGSSSTLSFLFDSNDCEDLSSKHCTTNAAKIWSTSIRNSAHCPCRMALRRACHLRTHAPQQRTCVVIRLFDHLIGTGEKHRRHFEAERLGCLQVYRQLELRWPLYRKLARLRPL